MKTNYTDAQLQAAIDGALHELPMPSLSLDKLGIKWRNEGRSRLALIKSALAALPEPETFEAHGKVWTRHDKSDIKPCECDGNRKINWLLSSELDGTYIESSMKASELHWGLVAAWRYADEPTPEQSANAKAHAEFQDELEAVWNGEQWTPKVGDVVTLKSGGPKMTVGKVSDETEIFCFRGDDLMKTAIPTACLQPA